MLPLQAESRQSARDGIVAKFPSLPATEVDSILAAHGYDTDAAMAHILSFSESTQTNVDSAGVDSFSKQAADHEFLTNLADTHLKKQTVALRRQLGERLPPAAVPSAEAIAEALLAVNRDVTRAKQVLLTGEAGACCIDEYQVSTMSSMAQSHGHMAV
jgi:hypothetical protein